MRFQFMFADSFPGAFCGGFVAADVGTAPGWVMAHRAAERAACLNQDESTIFRETADINRPYDHSKFRRANVSLSVWDPVKKPYQEKLYKGAKLSEDDGFVLIKCGPQLNTVVLHLGAMFAEALR